MTSPYRKTSAVNVTQMVVTGNEASTRSRDHQSMMTSRELAPGSRDQSTLPLPEEGEMDWTTLVHTATKAISVKGVNSEEDNLKKVEDLDDDELEITQR